MVELFRSWSILFGLCYINGKMIAVQNRVIILILSLLVFTATLSQTSLQNIGGRTRTSLNGKWRIIIDPYDNGKSNWTAIYKDRKPQTKTDFVEYSFENGPEFNVPGDFNSQMKELTFYESTVWYRKEFDYKIKNGKKLFLHFGAVNYKADVYVNNKKMGSHEGGFNPFQFDITDSVKNGRNTVIVRVNNQRVKDGIPGPVFDWFNYGGITRDVTLIETPSIYIHDYYIQLAKASRNEAKGWIKLNQPLSQKIKIQIPELKIAYDTKTDDRGMAEIKFTGDFLLWSPSNPKLYKIIIASETDTIKDEIGFRSIEVNGTNIVLNGKSIFLKGVNIHEEIPQEGRRAYSQKDAQQLLGWAKELGCNFVRLAHYPHNENTVRLAEKMGLMVWEEIPLWQGIDFADTSMQKKMNTMLQEMVQRDQNRCNVIIWSLSNETFPSPQRNAGISNMAAVCRSMDPTRLVASAIAWIAYKDSTVTIDDSINNVLDVVAVNEYLGWYRKWPAKPSNMKWTSNFDKPLIMSEFGGEALYGNAKGPKDAASSWSEDYQAKIYEDQLEMFKNIPMLAGVCPWILADFRSPGRMHPVFQKGWNRKGLIGETGQKKKAFYVMKNYYSNKK